MEPDIELHSHFTTILLTLLDPASKTSLHFPFMKGRELPMRKIIENDPYCAEQSDKNWGNRGIWDCKWIYCPDVGAPPFVTAYRCRFTVSVARTIRLHITADERYELYLDGVRVGRGSERGDKDHWYFETYDFDIMTGEHTLVARVWSIGEKAAYAQMSVAPGFLLSPQEKPDQMLLGTGIAAWEAKRLSGYTFVNPSAAWGTGENLVVDGSRFDWGFESGMGQGWTPAIVGEPGCDGVRRNEGATVHRLLPATLPPMLEVERSLGTIRHVADLPFEASTTEASTNSMTVTHGIPILSADSLPDEARAWQNLIDGSAPLTIPARTRRRVLLDLNDYVCAYPQFTATGGTESSVRIHWQESLFTAPNTMDKGNRDEVEGKYFYTIWHNSDGIGDEFGLEGGEHRTYETLWWQCGRFVEIVIVTGAEPLTLEKLNIRETRYPLEMESAFSTDDSRLTDIVPLGVRALQMCAHETYMDCPFYEQLMYVGDTRLEVLTTYALTHDDRLPRKALRMFDASRQLNGLTQSRYPTRIRQMIPPFSLWWVAMVHDYSLWRGDLAFVNSLMPGVRGVIDYFLSCRVQEDETEGKAKGLVCAPEGWNFMDWVPEWKDGTPADGHGGVSGVINWQFALVLRLVSELEMLVGEPELAARARRLAEETAAKLIEVFWDGERGLFADDVAHTHYSEHAQCLAILSGLLTPERQKWVSSGLLTAPDLARTTIYFTHYLFETYAVLGEPNALLERLALWFDLKTNGLKTTIEMPEPTRSDCHAWGAHPLYHYFATLLGIRPASSGFQTVRIVPQLGRLNRASGTLVHPKGNIEVDFVQDGDTLRGHITLPAGITGTFVHGFRSLPLVSGRQEVSLP